MQFINTCVSVDCVVFGFDGGQLNVLLVQRNSEAPGGQDLKLPGSLIYQEEDADTAANRVLNELTGIKKITLKQFKTFTSPQRTANPDDLLWLEHTYGGKISRLITISYLSLCKISRKFNVIDKYKTVRWCPVSSIPRMPFDHNRIVAESLREIGRWVEAEPHVLFQLLPAKFTAANLRLLYGQLYQKEYNIRNFHKKIAGLKYVVPLEEREEGAAHRAARYYKFDKDLYAKRMRLTE